MANHDPRPSPAATPTPPDPKQSPALIPIKSIQFLPGMNLDVPGLQQTNAVSSQDPSASAFRRIFFDARSQRFTVLYFKAGPELDRAPAAAKDFPAAICISERAL